MTRKVTLVAIVVLIAGFILWKSTSTTQPSASKETGLPAINDNRTESFPVFRESTYRVRSYNAILPSVDKPISILALGSGFLVNLSDDSLLIATARHVAHGADELESISSGNDSYKSDGTDRNSIRRIQERIRLGGKALIPLKYWHAPYSETGLDLSLFTISNPAPIESRPLQPGEVAKGSSVQIFGYPRSSNNGGAVSNLAVRTHNVTSLERDYFVTEGSELVTEGFSGGPVINEQGQVVGMAIRSTGYQVRCLYITDVLAAANRVETEGIVYRD